MTSLLTVLLFLTYTEPDPVTSELRPSLLLRCLGGWADQDRFDDGNLQPNREVVRDGENGLNDFVEAISLLPVDGGAADTKRLREMRSTSGEWDQEFAARVVKERADMFIALDRLVEKPRLQFRLNTRLTDNLGERFKSFAFTEYLAGRLRTYAHQNNWEEAMSSLVVLNKFAARVVECEGVLTQYLIGETVELFTMREIEWLLNEPGFPPALLPAMRDVIEARPDHAAARRFAWKNEYLLLHNLIDDLSSGLRLSAMQTREGEAEQRLDLEAILEVCKEQLILALLYQPEMTRERGAQCYEYFIAQAARGRVERKNVPRPEILDALRGRGADLYLSPNVVGNFVLSLILPGQERLLDRVDLVKSNAEALRLMWALRSYHVLRGELPKSLAELVPLHLPEQAVDPFTGETFKYSRERGQLWSPGSDGVDGKGEFKNPDQPAECYSDQRRWSDPTIRLNWIE